MPLGIQGINERTQRPNANINFIKPLPGPDQAASQDFLNRIAAQCYPVMKANYISVMSLAEHEHNNEFLGRNFNAGELIELVLKDKNGRWLGFKFVQMVMMHELAHCKQMNHSKYFWQVRNGYATEMEGLWSRKYLGEGLWGRGQELITGTYANDRMPAAGDVPEHLCGGTFRRRGRKRKRGAAGVGDADERPKVSYAERQQKRIAKKFGTHGDGAALGDDELVRGALEAAGGKRGTGKPRVANSKRGRELRAQAALARFGAAKVVPVKEEPIDVGGDSETEDEAGDFTYEQDETGFTNMTRVCGDEGEGEDEEGAGEEMDQLRKMQSDLTQPQPRSPDRLNEASSNSTTAGSKSVADVISHEDSETESEAEEPGHVPSPAAAIAAPSKPQTSTCEVPSRNSPSDQHAASTLAPPTAAVEATVHAIASSTDPAPLAPDPSSCLICSMANELSSPTCIACAHVLRPKLMPNHWRCGSEICVGSSYINAGDAGRCGVCSGAKPSAAARNAMAASSAGTGRAAGFIGGEVLRWD
nr:hypothetical protein B0A51_17753 [Rachicladosporium sp. CCFEE 5018]